MIILLSALIAFAYIAFCIYRILPLPTGWKCVAAGIFMLAFAGFFLSISGRVSQFPMGVASALYVTGNSCLIFALYAMLLFVLMRILQVCHVLPSGIHADSWTGSTLVFGTIAVLLVYGGLHYHHKYREEINLTTPKVSTPVKVVLASDLHIGYHNRRAELDRWVDIINSEHPDLVLFGGDIIDRSIRALQDDDDAAAFRRIEAPVYACLGNHEYYAGVEASEEFYRDAGIHLLKNGWTEACGLAVIGRDDNSNKYGRKPLGRFISDIDRDKFTILLDHQPEHLEEAEEAGIDFQFSGHTHNGQIWPATIVTRLKFEKSYGRYVKGNTNYYITSGMGIWGGKFRIGTRSEYVVLNLSPEN